MWPRVSAISVLRRLKTLCLLRWRYLSIEWQACWVMLSVSGRDESHRVLTNQPDEEQRVLRVEPAGVLHFWSYAWLAYGLFKTSPKRETRTPEQQDKRRLTCYNNGFLLYSKPPPKLSNLRQKSFVCAWINGSSAGFCQTSPGLPDHYWACFCVRCGTSLE